MSLSKIGNLVNTIGNGGDLSGVLKDFGTAEAAAKALSKYAKMDTPDIEAALKKAKFSNEDITKATASLTNLGSTAANTGNIITRSFSGIKNILTGLAAKLGVSATALGSTLGLAVGAAIVAGIYKAWDNAQQAKVEEAQSAFLEYENETNTTNEQIETVRELRAELEAGNLTAQEEFEIRSQILDIQNTLVQTYGAQAEGIDLVNGKLETELGLVNEITSAEARKTYRDNQEGFERAYKKTFSEDIFYLGEYYPNAQNEENKNTIEAIIAILSEYEHKGVRINQLSDGSYRPYITGTNYNNYQVVSEIEDRILGLFDGSGWTLEKYGEYDTNYASQTFERAAQALYDAVEENIEENYDTAFNGLTTMINLKENADVKNVYDTYQKALSEYQNASLKLDNNDKKSVDTFTKAYNNYRSAFDSTQKYRNGNYFEPLFDALDESFSQSVSDLPFFKTALTNGDQLNYHKSKLYKNMGDNLKEANLSSDDFRTVVDVSLNLTLDDMDIDIPSSTVTDVVNAALKDGIIDDTSYDSIEYLIDILQEVGIVAKDAEEEVAVVETKFSSLFKDKEVPETFEDIIAQYQTDISNLNEAIELFNNNELTGDNLIDTLGNIPELSDYINDLSTGLATVSSDKALNTIKDIRKLIVSADLDEDQKNVVNTYIENLLNSVDLSTADTDAIKNIIADNLFGQEDTPQLVKEYYKNIYNQLIEKFGNDDLSLRAIAKLTLTLDPALDWASEDLDALIQEQISKDTYVQNLLALTENDKASTRNSSAKDLADSKRSYKEAVNGKLSLSDYDDMIAEEEVTIGILNDRIKILENILESSLLSDSDRATYESDLAQAKIDVDTSKLNVLQYKDEKSLYAYDELQEEYDLLAAEQELSQAKRDYKEATNGKLSASDYTDMIKEDAKSIALLMQQRTEAENAIANAKTYDSKKTAQKNYNKIQQDIFSALTSRQENQKSLNEVPLEELKTQYADLERQLEQKENEIEFKKLQGIEPSVDDYNQLFETGKLIEENLHNQNQELTDLKENTDNVEFKAEYTDQINENTDSINGMVQKYSEWSDGIIEVSSALDELDEILNGIDYKSELLDRYISNKNDAGKFISYDDYQKQYDLSEEREQILIEKNQTAKDELYHNIVAAQNGEMIFNEEDIKAAQENIRQTSLEILDEQNNQENYKRAQDQIPITLYDNKSKELESIDNELDYKLSHVDQMTSDEQRELYLSLIKNAENSSEILKAQSTAYQQNRDTNYDINDPEYINLTDAINSNTDAIHQNDDDIAEYQKSLNEIPLTALQKEYDSLLRGRTALENQMSDKETYGGKITAVDYEALISESKYIDLNLRDQERELKLLIEKGEYVEEYQEQLDDVQDSIRDNKNSQYEWNKALLNLPLTNMENLSSAISSAFSELESSTGITIETVEALQAQFSDMADIDVQNALYRTAEGLKIDTDMLQEFADAQYEFTMNDFEASIEAQRKAIANYQEQIGAGNTDSILESMQDNLEGLLNRQAQYFASYQEQMQQFSKYNAIQIAKNTANAGDEYTSMLDEFETAVEAYNNGLIGTDDFKTVAEYFSPNGFNDDKNFAENYNKIQRYLTEDNTGPKNFLNDLVYKGYASYDNESKQYKYDIPNMRKAALDMGIGEEFMQSLFGRLEDYGFTNLFVSSMAEGTLKTEELSKELSEAKIRMAELQAQGADQSVLDSQQQYIDNLIAEQEGLQDAIQSYTTASTKDYIEGIVSGKEYINTLKDYADGALTPEEAQYYINEIQKYADEHGITLNADFSVNDEAYEELLSSLAIGSWENPLSAEDLGYTEGTKGAEVFLSTQKKILDTYAENREKLGELSQFTAAELYELASGLGNGSYDGDTDALHRAEDILEEIKQEAGLTDEEVKTLVKTLISLGYIDNPEWEAKIDTTELDEAEKRAYYLQGGTINYQMSTNLTDGAGELNTFVNGMTQGVSTSINVSVHGLSEAETLSEALGNVPAETPCVVTCTVESQEELDYLAQQVATYNEENGTQIILDATLAGSDKTAKDEIDDIVKHANSSNAEITVRADTQKAFYAANNAVDMISNKSATITIKADCYNLFKAVNTAIDMINKKTATVTVYKKTATTGQIDPLYTGTMTSVASHAEGTVPYNVLNTTPAYANGKVSLPHDETALVNELGQESRISNGVWSLLPPGMHFEHLKKGDIILNHKQTADLIKHGRASGTGHVRGYANGTLPDDYIPAFAGGTTSGNGGGGWGGALGTGKPLGSSSSSSTSSSDKYAQQGANSVVSAAESAEELFDWIEVLLTRLQAKTDSYIQKAENAITLSSSLKYYDKAIANVGEQKAANEAGARRYKKQADAVELDSSIKELVRNGKIDISKYSEETQKKITDYQTWFEKSIECEQNVADLQQQMIELAQSKLDAIIDKYDTIISRYDSYVAKNDAALSYRETAGYSDVNSEQKKIYQSSINKEQSILAANQKAQTTLKNEIDAQIAAGLMKIGDDRWKEAQTHIQEYDTAIYESKTAIEEWEQAIRQMKITKLERAISAITRWADQLSNILNLKEARGENVTEKEYKKQIEANNNAIYKEYEKLKALEKEQSKYERGSEKWEEYEDKKAESKSNIINLSVNNEGIKDSIFAERWEKFNKQQEENDYTKTELEYLRGMLGSSISSSGELTDDGMANIALLGKGIALEKQTIADYTEGLKKLDEQYKNGLISETEYLEKKKEYQGVIRDSASAVEDYKDELIDLYKEQISARNDVLLDNIDLWKKAAEEQENYYDYSKQIKNQRKTVDSLKAQAAALAGVKKLPLSI